MALLVTKLRRAINPVSCHSIRNGGCDMALGISGASKQPRERYGSIGGVGGCNMARPLRCDMALDDDDGGCDMARPLWCDVAQEYAGGCDMARPFWCDVALEYADDGGCDMV